jgi:hypothetical protein
LSITSGIGPRAGWEPARIGVELAAAEPVEDRLCHQRARGVAGAQEQDIEGGGHGSVLRKVVGQEPREVAAQVGAAAAAGLGEKAEQRAQAEEAHGVDELPPVPRRLDQAGLLECRQMKGQRGWRQPQCR